MSTYYRGSLSPAYDFRIPIVRCLQAFVFVGAVVLSPSLGLVRADGTQPDTRRKAILRLDQLVQDQKVTASEAEGFRRLFSDFPSDRFRLFLPSPTGVGRQEAPEVVKIAKFMQDDLLKLAEECYQTAQQELDRNQHRQAFAHLFQCLAFHPKHEKASTLLKPWLDATSRRQVQAKADRHLPDIDWKAGSYATATTPHFTIHSRAPTRLTAQLADLCEQTYCAWQQIFFEYWCGETNTLEPFQSKNAVTGQERFRIVLCRDQAEYIKLLQSIEPNIRVSTGYYHPRSKTAFFYWDARDPQRTTSTLRHELAHMFFQQAGQEVSQLDSDKQAGIWVVEGIALYFESLSLLSNGFMDAVEIGGWDAPRLQAARFRRLHDETWIPWNEFHAETGEKLRARSDIAQWYTQAAGLVHFMMDRSADSRSALQAYLQRVYQGNPQSTILDGSSDDDALREHYDAYLQDVLKQIPGRTPLSERNDIVLSRIPVTSESLLAWPSSVRKLQWMDLSFTQVDDSLLAATPAWDIVRLSVEGTKVTNESMPTISKMPRLEELDLSLCSIDDKGLEHLRGNSRLKYLWLTGTSISDHSFEVLKTLRSLELLDVSQTAISAETVKKLRKALPKWKTP